jgi:serine/threonine-protein kinase
MELCEGGSLRDLVGKGPLPPDEALRRAAELCATLAAVHRRNIAHGDVKPGNLLLRSAGGELVLVDFGLAKLQGTDQGEFGKGGTLAYMAPEQRQGLVTPLSDVHAAGVITVELLMGSPALAGWLGDRARLLRGEGWDGTLPPSLAERDAKLRPLLLAMMARDAAARPSAEQAAQALSVL